MPTEFYEMTDSMVMILFVAWSLVALKYGLRGAKSARSRMYRIVGLLFLTGAFVAVMASYADSKVGEAKYGSAKSILSATSGRAPVRKVVIGTSKPATRPAGVKSKE
ncbi:MAG TPA: hypothetical protein PKY77_05705 [Phycisphaerae bacterium]|nr:hypothetical protein [Phycisphaerae bacterium]HRY69061.1 hypothetical protein [Phycisphaerae bacterium]HSA25964.1 hypothetical protein [Phycisphaerae bacterium]